MCLSLCHESFPNPGHWWLAKESLFQRWSFFPWKPSSFSRQGWQEHGFPTTWAGSPGSFFPEPKSRLRTRNKREMDWEEAETYPSDTEDSNGCQGTWWASEDLFACGHPALTFPPQELLLVGSFSGRSRAMAFKPHGWPSNFLDVLQIFQVLGDLSDLAGHGFKLPVPVMLHFHTAILTEIALA